VPAQRIISPIGERIVAMPSKRPEQIKFDQKIVIVLEETLPATTALIVVAHTMTSLGYHASNIMGCGMIDQSGNTHLALPKYPVVVLQANPEAIRVLANRAKAEQILVVDFPRQAIDLWTDEELVRDITSRKEHELEYLAIGMCAAPHSINALTGGLKLYRPA
jgi:hypothetical protein